MKHPATTLVAAFLLSALPLLAQAADTPDWSVTGNASLVSDYRFRGISQTHRRPAIQGGIDVSHSSGLYLGNWNSNVDSAFYNGANIEMDFYGGYKLPAGPLTLDFGALYYHYPGSGAGGTFKIDNTELYVGATFGAFSLKYSHAVSDFFGVDDSKNAWYLDGSGSYDLGSGFTLVGHVGYQKLRGNARVVEIGGSEPRDSIVDYKVGVGYDLKGWGLAASYIGSNRDLTGGTAAPSNKNISDGTVVLSVSKAF